MEGGRKRGMRDKEGRKPSTGGGRPRSLAERLITRSPSRRPPAPPAATGREETGDRDSADAAARKPCGWKCMPYIIGNETFEKVASTGLTANLTVYLVEEMHMRQVAAANLTTVFAAASNFAPLAGAFVADACLGRFRTLLFASLFTAAVGFRPEELRTFDEYNLIASVPGLQPPPCTAAATEAPPGGGRCDGPSAFQLAALAASLLLLAVGSGGVRPCSQVFGVDQFDAEAEGGRHGLASFFNWYYFTTTAGTMLSMTVVVYIQDIFGWSVGFGVPMVLMLIAIAFFLLGSRLYVHIPPDGGVFTRMARVVVASFRKRALWSPAAVDATKLEPLLYRSERRPLTNQLAFLNKAAIVCDGELKEGGTPADPWRLASVQDIEELKCLIHVIPVWSSGLIAFLALSQQWGFSVLQALCMDRRLGPTGFQIPAGSIGTISLIGLTIFIPIYDRLLVPVARRLTGLDSGITTLQRQGVGMLISPISMILSGVVEAMRRETAASHGDADGTSPSSMPVLWLAPPLALMGVTDAFIVVGQMEFFNREFPESMRSVAGSLFYCSLAGSGYLGAFLVAVVESNTSWLADNIDAGRLDYFYYLIAAMGIANFFYFTAIAHFYRYNSIPEVKERKPDGIV